MNVIKKIRMQLCSNQKEFAQQLNVSIDTVKSWETGRRHPTSGFIEMLILLNQDPNLVADLEDMHPIFQMVKDVLEYIKEQTTIQGDDAELRFVLYGASGSGKSRIVDLVNKKLPKNYQLVECCELIFKQNLCKAWEILNDKKLRYLNSRYTAFSVLSEELAASLESNGVKVFRLT